VDLNASKPYHPFVNSKNEDLARFGNAIRQFRKLAGLSQEAFAERCGLDRTYIGGVERGERNISLKNILRIARVIGVPPTELFRNM